MVSPPTPTPMPGRYRILFALCCATLFWLLPDASPTSGRRDLGELQVREWLLGPDSPLSSWGAADLRPQLAVDLSTSPPITDRGELQSRQQGIARLADEWRLGPGRNAATAPPTAVPLALRIGERGLQAEMPLPDGAVWRRSAPLPDGSSLLPALCAIAVAVLFRRVLLALLAAGLVGAVAWALRALPDGTPARPSWLVGTEHYFIDALWRRSLGEDFYLRITAFVVFLFMTIGLISRNGGVHGLVSRLQRVVRGPVSAQLASFTAGILVFFDDYTNCLLVGTTMRPLCDRARVSREKLAYLVDSTAAPIAGLSVFSTWIVYEMSTYRAPLTMVTRADGTPFTENDAFSVFLDSMPFRFYSLFALLTVLLVIVLRRDFGPMLRAERRARLQGQPSAPDARPLAAVDERLLAPPADLPCRARNALLPLCVLVFGTIGTMLWQGMSAAPPLAESETLGAWLRLVLAGARSDVALLWSALAAWLTAIVVSRAQGLLGWRTIIATSLRSTRALYLAFGILFLAWTLGHICRDLGTSRYLAAIARGSMHAGLLPVLLFGVAGAIAFATGTSFGTMAILLPNVVVLAHQLGTDAAFGGDAATGGVALMLLSIGAVLEGSIFGDHCSPLSDTTVLSALGSQCDLLAHVTTQLPYALTTMAVSVLCGYLPVLWFGPQVWPFALLGGVLALGLLLRTFGRDPAASP